VPELERYLVELHRPLSGWQELQGVTAQARAAAEQLSEEGTPVRFLRSIFVPEDDSCFFLYEGPSADVVGEAGRRAALAVERVVEAVHVGGEGTAEGVGAATAGARGGGG
jgi:hypothetical protein